MSEASTLKRPQMALVFRTEETVYPLRENHLPLQLKTSCFPRYQYDLSKNKHLINEQHETLFFYLMKRANILL